MELFCCWTIRGSNPVARSDRVGRRFAAQGWPGEFARQNSPHVVETPVSTVVVWPMLARYYRFDLVGSSHVRPQTGARSDSWKELPMSQANNPNAVVSTERVLSVNPRDVFAAFEQPDRLAQWWGPNGFRNTFEQFEFTPGGRWVL
jgi:hypothetical protein